MDVSRWEAHTMRAIEEERNQRPMLSIVHYQLALSEAEALNAAAEAQDDLEMLLTIRIASCHNLAAFWRKVGEHDDELKYLQLASEHVLNLLPQCPNKKCDAFISSLGCCKAALVSFLKRHPDPQIAKQVENFNHYSHCELIARFQIH
ncbi:DUF2753 family protein [Thaumasiovibrio subtropicus]|uniref:DUF2753 family protein n=1 Tax=Thaumasiovibrio subtropicus TaxID=1891207 RepID=UPI000B3548F3|nr:DUF2753 family protein [Thaumasiovibrio subtropicus]